MAGKRAHVSNLLRGSKVIHGNLALSRAKLEGSGGSRRGRVDDLDEVVAEGAVLGVAEGAANEVGVGRLGASVEAGAGEVEDGRDAVRLDGVTREVLGTLKVWNRVYYGVLWES
jgi:hypothetical protein